MISHTDAELTFDCIHDPFSQPSPLSNFDNGGDTSHWSSSCGKFKIISSIFTSISFWKRNGYLLDINFLLDQLNTQNEKNFLFFTAYKYFFTLQLHSQIRKNCSFLHLPKMVYAFYNSRFIWFPYLYICKFGWPFLQSI